MVRKQYVLDSWKTIRADTIAAVQDFPAEELDAKPIEDFMSFRELAIHTLNVGHGVAGMILAGETDFTAPDARQKMAKHSTDIGKDATSEQIAEALRDSVELRTRELGEKDDAFFLGEMKWFDGKSITRLELTQWIKEHELTHRAQMFMLLRMQGIVPATTRRRRAAAK